ncbi:hypothetical protein ACIRON_15670 [Nocardioides sp. NPDC101246]|uniref:hypothetical protein n=1 Tax=Nocardioides sp. NPDC101246 TaxID=3364336 RepID=UPI0037FB8B0E
MSDESALFDFADEPSTDPVPAALAPIRTWQVDQLRQALDATNATSMEERQALVEEHVGRPVGALRELHYDDVRPLLEALHKRKVATVDTAGSAWDHRDEDTWIDKL